MCWLLLHQPVGDNSVYNGRQIKVNVFRIILDYESSAFTRGILPFWNQILKDPYWVFQWLFIIVCSWDPIMATLRALERLHFRCVSCRAKRDRGKKKERLAARLSNFISALKKSTQTPLSKRSSVTAKVEGEASCSRHGFCVKQRNAYSAEYSKQI